MKTKLAIQAVGPTLLCRLSSQMCRHKPELSFTAFLLSLLEACDLNFGETREADGCLSCFSVFEQKL